MLLTGRITANAEVATVKGDRKVTNFTVALNQRFKTKAGEKRERTAFVDCAYWGNSGLAEYLTKGAVVEVSGWIEAQVWTDRDGKAHPRLNCNADNIKLFSTAPKATEAPKATAKEKVKDIADADQGDDDLPF